MNLFRQILGKSSPKAPPIETYEQRLAKLEAQPEAERVDFIREAHESKEELELQVALTATLSYGPALIALAEKNAASSDIEKAARKRIAALLAESKIKVDTVLGDVSDLDCRLAIAAFAKSEAMEARCLADIQDQARLAELCENASSAKVRQSLAERIDDPQQLRKLAKQLKNKDKKAYKVVKTKLDHLRAEEAKEAEEQAKIDDIIKAMAQHENRAIDREYALRFDLLQTRWQEVADAASDEQKMHYENARFVCESKINEAKAEIEAEEMRAQAISQAQDKRHSVLDKFWALISEILSLDKRDETTLTTFSENLEQLTKEWDALKQLKKPSPKEEKDHTLMVDAIVSLLSAYQKGDTLKAVLARIDAAESADPAKEIKLLKNLIYPVQALKHYPACEPLTQARETIDTLDADREKKKQEHEKQLRIIGGLVKKSHRAVDEGHLKKAIGIRHSIDEKIESLDAVPAHLTRQLESLDEAVQKLVDWQAYAVVPKKEKLIAEMEKLVDCDIPPEALATKIKRLQDEWKSLSQSGKDRGEELWQQFSDLSDKAYEPCKIYYQELAELRKDNLEKRKTLVQQLQDFYQQYDWDKADWKHVEKIMRTARGELHAYSPVERSANKPVLEEFDLVIDKLHAKIKEEFDRNKASKEQLILQAQKAVDIADIHQATETVKRLQAQWKNIGRCQYRDNENLWKEFREHCDKVFARKDQKMTEQRAQTDAKIAEARAFVDKMNALGEKSDDALLSARSERDELQNSFASVAEGEDLPEKVQRAIVRDFNKAVEDFDKKVDQALLANDRQAWISFFEACEKINAAQAQEGGSAEDLEAYVAEVSQWPEGCAAVIKEKLKAEDDGQSIDERIKTLRLLCVRAEILADKESPEDDKALRMEHQVKMLQQGLGGQRQNDGKHSLAKEWALVKAVPKADYQRLFERFNSSWSKLK